VIVNTASVAAFDGQIGQLAYSASKGGIVGMTLPAARDLSAVGHPRRDDRRGTFDHAAVRRRARRGAGRPRAAVPFPKRMGRPEEYAALVAHIARTSC